jgi:hypothetical protein
MSYHLAVCIRCEALEAPSTSVALFGLHSALFSAYASFVCLVQTCAVDNITYITVSRAAVTESVLWLATCWTTEGSELERKDKFTFTKKRTSYVA